MNNDVDTMLLVRARLKAECHISTLVLGRTKKAYIGAGKVSCKFIDRVHCRFIETFLKVVISGWVSAILAARTT
jgi:hypothetical protein